MNSKRLAIAAVLAAVTTALSQSTPPPIPIELRARFGFTGPLVQKVGDGVRFLKVADIDGDGRPEAIAFDSRRARLVAVRVDGGKTTLQPIPTGGQIGGYTVADVDGDGKAQVIIVDSRGRMSVRKLDGTPATRPFDLGLGGRGLGLFEADLDNDGKQDIVALAPGKMRVVTQLGETPQLMPIEPTEEQVFSMNLLDLDQDENIDMLCIVQGDRMNLRLRLGLGDGTFGAWRITSVDNLRAVFSTTLPDGKPALATVEGPMRRVALHRYADHGDQAALQWWAFGEGDGTKTPPFAIGDVDNDGDQDLVLFPRERAQMVVYEWRKDTFVRRALPTLAGVGSVAIGDVDRDGKLDLVLASPEEDALAWCSGAAPLDRFPAQLPAVDKPIAATVDPNGGVLVLGRNKRRNAQLHRSKPGGEPELLADLGRMPADPGRLLVADVGDRDGVEIAFVVPGEGLRTLTLDGNKKPDQKPAAGFTRRMDDGALGLCEHDGKPTLVAVRERFVRCFRFDDKGQVRVVTQDNGPEGAQELTLACELGEQQWLYFDKKSDKLLRTQPGKPVETIEVPALGFRHLIAHEQSALLIGPRGLLRVPFRTGPSLRVVASHAPPTERTYYAWGKSGDFDGDGIADLAILDRRLPGVQILAGGPKGLARALAIPVFETPPSESPDSEPSALATGDLDGDGRCDLVLIAHDRILIYPQDQ